jgi:hypothetical protein
MLVCGGITGEKVMQLLIVDVQNTYLKYCQDLLVKIPQFAQNFSEVIYLFDNINNEDFHSQVPDLWMQEEYQEFYDRWKVISKNYAFFRGLMDAGIDEDDQELVKLAQFLRKYNLNDAREICPDNPKIWKTYQKEFKHSPLQNINFEDYGFYLPEDLITDLENSLRDGVVLVGGGRQECLKEVALLLRVLGIKFTIHEELTY